MGSRPAAIVTGAGRRIGRGIALKLSSLGYDLLLHYNRSLDDAQSLCDEINARCPGSAALYKEDFSMDVRVCTDSSPSLSEKPLTLRSRCQGVVRACIETFGRCDVLVNNASAYMSTPLVSPPSLADVEENESNLFGSNALAPLYLIQAFASADAGACSAGNGGSLACTRTVVNLLDSMLDRPQPGYCVYTMGKYALLGLTKCAAVELAPEGVRVNAVAPGLSVLPEGMIEAEKAALRLSIPLGQREASVEDVADAVAYLLSATYITGTVLQVDGGWQLAREAKYL